MKTRFVGKKSNGDIEDKGLKTDLAHASMGKSFSSTKICDKTNIINYLFNIELIIDEENQYVIRSS